MDHIQDDMFSVSLPYAGTSGWSGTTTSKERAVTADNSGKTKDRQKETYDLLQQAGTNGLTWKELSSQTQMHHGTASGTLSVMHKDQRIIRLTDKRNRCKIYVHPDFVIGRETETQGNPKQCPNCGHKLN